MKFTTYFDGDVLIAFSYTSTTMTKQRGRGKNDITTVDITPAQFHDLENMPADAWTQAASVFCAANRATAQDGDDENDPRW